MTISNFLTSKIKNAFTLAEVLITLVIIGVVAALAISPLINTYVESSTVSKVKKGLSILGQAKKLAEVQNGSIEGWDFDGVMTVEDSRKFLNYILPHLSIAKDCGTDSDCYPVSKVYRLDGNEHEYCSSHYSSFNKFVLADGSIMFFTVYEGKCTHTERGVDNSCGVFYYDVNGDKKPNTIGRDIFAYFINPDGVYPPISNDCNKNNLGWGCAAYIIKNSNMKYLH